MNCVSATPFAEMRELTELMVSWFAAEREQSGDASLCDLSPRTERIHKHRTQLHLAVKSI